MKNKILKFLPFIIAAVVCITVLVVVIATTSGGSGVTEIYILSSNTPRLNYVEGQELDLSGGILTVVIEEEEQKVPLTSEDVSIIGYDKNKIGEQKLEVSYDEFKTTLTVNVIPRVLIEGYEPNYFVGDVFNKDAGKIKIANDNANGYTTVNMGDSRVTVVSFDSSCAGTSTVEVNCTVNGNTYPCSFDVTVYAHSNVTFTPPSITTYYSHDTAGLNVAKGNFTVTSSDSKLTKNVKLLPEMVSGFDLSVATIADRNKPVTQTLTVTYLDKTFTYDITVYYSGVSVVEHYANSVLSKIDWSSNEDPSAVMTDEQMEIALDAINTYYKLDKVDRDLISSESRKVVARAAAVAAGKIFAAELDSYSETFSMATEPKIALYLSAKNYEKVSEDAKRLADPNAELHTMAALLRKIEGDFPSVNVVGTTKISDYIVIYTEDIQTYLVDAITHLVSVFEPIKDIPVEWDLNDLREYGDAILSSAVSISTASYYSVSSELYTEVMSNWREKGDFFEIIYSYLLYVHEDGKKVITGTMMGKAPLPSALEEWYNTLIDVVEYEVDFKKYATTDAALADISPLMYLYFLTIERGEDIKKNGTQLEKDLYAAIDGDYYIRYYGYTYDYGYIDHAGGLIDSELYNTLWKTYYEVLKLYNTGDLDAEEHRELIVEMYNLFQQFTPAELYGFLSSLNLSYDLIIHSQLETPILILEFFEGEEDDTTYNIFTLILRDYFRTYLNDASKPIFEKLLLAMEHYALLGNKATALQDFKTVMAEVIGAYEALSDEDAAQFDSLLGVGYSRYLGIYNLAVGNTTFTPEGVEAELLNKIHNSMVIYFNIYNHMTTLVNIPDEYYGLLIASFADLMQNYKAFMSSASDEALLYFYQHGYIVNSITTTLDMAFSSIDNVTTGILTRKSASLTTEGGKIVHVTAWDLFIDYEVDGVLARMLDLLYYAFDASSVALTEEYIFSLTSEIWALSDFQRSILTYLSTDKFYWDALEAYYNATLTADGASVAAKLLDAEEAYINRSKDESKATFLQIMAELAEVYESLSDTDKAALDAMYNRYAALSAEMA